MAEYRKPDYWQQKSQREGYPARSVYKLMEIDEKFGLLKIPAGRSKDSGLFRVLDLGAAPGSWSLYVLRKMTAAKVRKENPRTENPHFLAAADLSPLSRKYDKGLFDNDNFFFVQGDITAEETKKALIDKGPYSTIISDAAPSTTGSRTVDAARSYELCETVIDYAETALTAGGMLAFKVFQGDDSATLLKRLKPLFGTVKTFKPQACRDNSMETYFIGMGCL